MTRKRRLIVEALVVLIGLVLVAGALAAKRAWFERHFLPVYFVPPRQQRLGEEIARAAVGGLGLVLALFIRPRAGRAAAGASLRGFAVGAARVGVALVLAAAVCELGLRLAFPRATQEAAANAEPLRRRDPHLGWVFVPSRVAWTTVAGHAIDYAFDAQGYRAPSLALPVDPGRPAILFTGESIVTGFGLPWERSFPARVAQSLGAQAANMAVFAYADDQALMRLQRELPRFAQPKAVVVLFSPGLMFRDFDEDRPHLGPGLAWAPARTGSRLWALIRFFVPYHAQADIDRHVALVRAELQADVALARSRQALALVVVPHYGADDPRERRLRKRVLDGAGTPYVVVQLDPRWRNPGDVHPDARGAQAIAAAVEGGLRAEMGSGAPSNLSGRPSEELEQR